jgi:hypothetical protein
MASPPPLAASRRLRLTLAPRTAAPILLEASQSRSRFSCLGSDSSGSDGDGESIPVSVALSALDKEVRVEDGWTPVSHRRKKSAMDTINDF